MLDQGRTVGDARTADRIQRRALCIAFDQTVPVQGVDSERIALWNVESDLAKELRTKLDKGGADADMSHFSGRGLAIIALNQDGTFSREEVYAAKSELRERDRQSAITFLNSGELTSTSLKAYTQQLLASRQSQSGEEQQLRDIDPNLR